MKNDGDKKNKIVTNKSANDAEVIPLSTIKRMMNTLDRFLTKRFMFILAFCGAVISMCAVGLVFANGILGNAATSDNGGGTSGGDLTLKTWLWSAIAVFGFIALVATIYNLGKKRINATNSIK